MAKEQREKGGKGGYTPRDPSTLHCYWFHHSKCQRPKRICVYKHDKQIIPKEEEDSLALGFAKRSSSEPPKKAAAIEGSDEAKAKKRVCNEFKKLGKCSKGNDCAYEHVAAAPEGSKKEKKPPKGALATPVIFAGEEDTEECDLAACKDRRVTYPKLKTSAGEKTQYQKEQNPLREARLRKPARKICRQEMFIVAWQF